MAGKYDERNGNTYKELYLDWESRVIKRITIYWDKVCKPINEGGLGLKRLRAVNFSVLINGWMIRNDSSIDFWNDVWVENTSLASQSSLPLSAFKHSKARVSHFISGNPQTWCFPMYEGIHPRVSLMSWKVANNSIVIDEKIRSIGILLVLCYSLCGNSMETRDHLFVTCFFANSMWSWFSNLFGLPLPCDMSFEAFSKKWKGPGCHGKTKDLWIIGWSHIITAIWMSRNKCRFDKGRPMSQIQWSKKWIMKRISSITSNWRDFKAKPPGNDPFILEVIWLPPMSGCVKLNIDGCSKRNPGRSGFGGPILMGTNYLVELTAFICGVEYVIKNVSQMFGLNVTLWYYFSHKIQFGTLMY
ncbi:hypothetical protein AMTRI_Chr08g206450 [Amborella trichopoda]